MDIVSARFNVRAYKFRLRYLSDVISSAFNLSFQINLNGMLALMRTTSFPPNGDTLPQRHPAIHSHLLTTIPFLPRHDENFLYRKAEGTRDVGQNHVNRNAHTGIADVVVYHEEACIRFQHTRALADNARHLIEIAAHHAWDAAVVKHAFRFLVGRIGEDCL